MRAAPLLLLVLATACRSRQTISDRSVLGKVLDESSVPMAGVTVKLVVEPTKRKRDLHSATARTNENGWFVFNDVPLGPAYIEPEGEAADAPRRPVRSGMVILTIRRRGGAAAEPPAAPGEAPAAPGAPEPAPGGPAPTFDVPEEPAPETPPAPALAIDGVVTFDGAALEGAMVEAVGEDRVEAGWSDAEGKFAIGGLAEGEYRLVLTLPPDAKDPAGAYIVARRDASFPAEAGRTGFRIDLPAGAMVKIVTNFPSVSIEGDGIIARRYDVPAEGTLQLRGFPAGRVRFYFHKPDGGLQPVEEELREGQVLPLEMRLPEGE